MSNDIIIVIVITSFATYLSRFLGVISSKKIKENSKIFRWFNCLAYSTLAALIARTIIFPVGALNEVSNWMKLSVIVVSLIIFYYSKKNLVYPTIFSAIMLATINHY
jgi:branched-subunit amino acid transport protein